MLEAERPDVVLLDIMMPQIDGIQVLQLIRLHDDLRHIPVLILTASTDRLYKAEGPECGGH